MLKSIKISLKDTIIYGLGNVAVKLVGLILIPLFTNPKFFSTEEFGVMGILEISGVVLTALLASGLPQSLTRWFWDKDHRDNQKGIFFMSLSTQITISIIFCIVLIPLSGTISTLIFSKPGWAKAITYVILASGIQSINNVVNTLMRLQSRSVLYTITNLFKLTFVLAITLFFILSKKMGLEGYYLAQLIGNGFIVLLLAGYTIKNARPFFDKDIFKSMNVYGFPLLLANISAALLAVIDRFSLNALTVLKSVALYTLAVKITSVLKLVLVDSIKLALGPMMIKRIGTPNSTRFYSKVLLYSSYIVMFAIVGVSLFSFEIVKVIATSRAYWDAVVIIPFLSLSIFFVNMKEVTVYGLHIAKKTNIIGFIVVFSTILSLALNILLIPVWDITGAAVATLISQFVYWYACYYFSQKVFFIPYEIKKIVLLVVTGSVLSFGGMLLNGMDLLPRIAIKTLCFISFPFILYLFRFYEPIELQSMKGIAIKWLNVKNIRKNIASMKGLSDSV
jgi:O-antigen/teichoic acid export membrane protein